MTVVPPGIRARVSRGALLRAVLLVGLLVIALIAIQGLAGDVPAALDALATADPRWLAAALVAELLSYLLIAATFHRLTGPGDRVGAWLSVRTAFVTFGLGNILPGSPAPGITLAAVDLRKRGLPARKTTLAMGWTGWFLIRGFLAVAAAAAILAAARNHVPESHEAVVLGVASFVLALLLLTAMFALHPRVIETVASKAARLRWKDALDDEEARVIGQHWHSDALQALNSNFNRQTLAAAAVAAWLADALCLRFALLAVGIDIDLDIVLLGYVAAILASCVPFLPGGAGAVEAVLPALLNRYGIPLEAGIAATLAWRALALLLPAALGMTFLLAPKLRGLPSAIPSYRRASGAASQD